MTQEQDGPSIAPPIEAVELADELAAGQVQWHSSEEDGGPDVGILVGLGGGKSLWFGELLDDEGRFGFAIYGPTEKAAVASHDDYDAVRELIEDHVATALRQSPPVQMGGVLLQEAIELAERGLRPNLSPQSLLFLQCDVQDWLDRVRALSSNTRGDGG